MPKKSGLLNRKEGNFNPTNQFNSTEQTSDNIEQNKTVQKTKTQSKKRKNIKVSELQKNSLDALKHINNVTYDYEIIQILIDSYVDSESETVKRKFKTFLE